MFRQVASRSGYESWILVEEFKKGMNGSIKYKLTEIEWPPKDIKEWFEQAINLNRY